LGGKKNDEEGMMLCCEFSSAMAYARFIIQ